MTKFDVAKFCCRFVACYFWISAARGVVSFVVLSRDIGGVFGGGNDTAFLVLQFFLMTAIPAGIGLFLWMASAWIAQKVVKDDKQGTSISGSEFQATLFSTVGLYLLTRSIPWIVAITGDVLGIRPGFMGVEVKDVVIANHKADIIALAVQVIIGVWLLLGSSGIVNAVSRLRGSGTGEAR
ncbi:MAG: hypothetical protein OEV59_03245 [Deltaproteobacteria bacterium]|nr:hypothetical protein [Deltaproteobacteria bacterium]